MAATQKFFYDELSDSLMITTRAKNDKVQGSIAIGDLILDINQKKKIIGVEIENFSEFHRRITGRQMGKIENAILSLNEIGNGFELIISIKMHSIKEPQRMAVLVSQEDCRKINATA